MIEAQEEGSALSAMQRRDKQHVIPLLQPILLLSLELPIRIIDEDQDSWSSARWIVNNHPHDFTDSKDTFSVNFYVLGSSSSSRKVCMRRRSGNTTVKE